jgi:beta-lactamase class D
MRAYLVLFACFLPISLSAQPGIHQPFLDCGIDGSITLYHLENDTWVFSDSTDAYKETLPASTFKILNSAIALETGSVSDVSEVFEWNGTENTFFGVKIDSWNEDINMENAFKTSAIWFYEELSKKIGKEKYRTWLASVNYGNGDFSETGYDFWNFGGFGVSPVNQIVFLKSFYLEELPFSADTYQSVKKMILSEENESHTISGKTGWTKTETEDIGWWIGYVEKENETWFFATRIIKSLTENNPDFSACRTRITLSVLNNFGVLE